MTDFSDRRVQLENKQRSVIVEYREAAAKFARGEVGDSAITTAKANVESVKAQIEALDFLADEMATKQRETVARVKTEEERKYQRQARAKARRILRHFSDEYLLIATQIESVGAHYQGLMAKYGQLDDAVRAFGNPTRKAVNDSMIMPVVLDTMLGTLMMLHGLSTLACNTPKGPGLDDERNAATFEEQVLSTIKRAENLLGNDEEVQ